MICLTTIEGIPCQVTLLSLTDVGGCSFPGRKRSGGKKLCIMYTIYGCAIITVPPYSIISGVEHSATCSAVRRYPTSHLEPCQVWRYLKTVPKNSTPSLSLHYRKWGGKHWAHGLRSSNTVLSGKPVLTSGVAANLTLFGNGQAATLPARTEYKTGEGRPEVNCCKQFRWLVAEIAARSSKMVSQCVTPTNGVIYNEDMGEGLAAVRVNLRFWPGLGADLRIFVRLCREQVLELAYTPTWGDTLPLPSVHVTFLLDNFLSVSSISPSFLSLLPHQTVYVRHWSRWWGDNIV